MTNEDGWRFEKEWPLRRQELKKYFLFSNAALKSRPTATGQETYQTDYFCSSIYGSNNGNRWLGIASNEPNALPMRTDYLRQRSKRHSGAGQYQRLEVISPAITTPFGQEGKSGEVSSDRSKWCYPVNRSKA